MHYESKILNVKLRRAKIHYVPDVVYKQAPTFEKPNQLLQMDLLIPETGKKMAAVIFITGGGFICSNRARCPQLRLHLAENNFVVASINYRTTPNNIFPAPIEDVKSAIRFLKANAQKFSVDAEQIFLIGDSAGGYLTAFAAVTNGDEIFNVGENLDRSSKIVAAVDLYGVSDPARISDDLSEEAKALNNMPGAVEAMFINGVPNFTGTGGGISAYPEKVAKANPLNYITKNSAPMLLMHGTADSIVSPSQSDILFQALKNAGVEAERWLIPNAEHSDDYWVQDEVLNLITEYFNRYRK